MGRFGATSRAYAAAQSGRRAELRRFTAGTLRRVLGLFLAHEQRNEGAGKFTQPITLLTQVLAELEGTSRHRRAS